MMSRVSPCVVLCGFIPTKVSWTKEEVFDEGSPVIFCDFLKPGAEKRLYEESKEMGKMQQVCNARCVFLSSDIEGQGALWWSAIQSLSVL